MKLFPMSLPARVGALFGAHFFGMGIFLPFFPVVLAEKGLTSSEIGLILGMSMIAKNLANPLMASLSDRTGRRRLSIFVYSCLAAVFLAAFDIATGFTAILIVIAGFTVFWSPVVPLSDAYALDVVRQKKGDYGRMRLWGSIGFVVANTIGGWLSVEYSSGSLVWGLMATALATGLIAISLPGMQGTREDKSDGEGNRPAVFKEPWFLGVLVIVGALQATHGAYYALGSIFWVESGASEFTVGLLWAIGVITEIILFFAAGRLGLRVSPIGFLVIGGAASVIRWLLFPFATDLWSMFALQTLHGLSFGAVHLGMVGYLAKVVPPKWAATGQSLAATSSGFMMAAGMALSGRLYALDPAYAFWAMAVQAAAGLTLLAVLAPTMRARAVGGG